MRACIARGVSIVRRRRQLIDDALFIAGLRRSMLGRARFDEPCGCVGEHVISLRHWGKHAYSLGMNICLAIRLGPGVSPFKNFDSSPHLSPTPNPIVSVAVRRICLFCHHGRIDDRPWIDDDPLSWPTDRFPRAESRCAVPVVLCHPP